jgi:hypothetical protein
MRSMKTVMVEWSKTSSSRARWQNQRQAEVLFYALAQLPVGRDIVDSREQQGAD